jgi:RNA polymerase sigma-70 factor (ECF subfamily)
MASLSEEDLIKLYREKQDPEILGSLYKPYMYLVYGVCLKYLKNREDSQDAVMQIFEILVKDVPRFEIRNFRAWLLTVSRNYCLMQLRKSKKMSSKTVNFSNGNFMDSTLNLHPVEETNNEELQDRLKVCLEQLKKEQRMCVELFYYQQQCYKEIALHLNMDEQKVKSHIQNGKRNLKICIESKATIGDAGNR